MQEIAERRQLILETVVSEYIKRAFPISSEFLKNEKLLDVSPATIRLDLAELTKKGFLRKTYISSGRVPTEKGYRFFVNHCFNSLKKERKNKTLKEFKRVFSKIDDIFKLSHKIAFDLAENSCNLSIVCFDDFDVLWKEGWNEVVKAPEFCDVGFLKNFIDFVSDFEQEFKDMKQFENFENNMGNIRILIGKESPSTKKGFSAILGTPSKKARNEYKLRFAILGPERMNFRKNINLINALVEAIEEMD